MQDAFAIWDICFMRKRKPFGYLHTIQPQTPNPMKPCLFACKTVSLSLSLSLFLSQHNV